jgi:hypothetical protein
MEYKNEEFLTSPEKLYKYMKKNKCVVFKFSAKWCGPCKNKDFLDQYHDLKLYYDKSINVKFIELDVDNDSELIADDNYYDFNISSIPAFRLYYSGKYISEHSGTRCLGDIQSDIDTILRKLSLN